MAGVEQNRYKTDNGCIKHLPPTGISSQSKQKLRIINGEIKSENPCFDLLFYKPH